MKNVICGLLVVIGIFGVLMWSMSGVSDTQEQYGGSYSGCIQENDPSVCKRVFLD